MLFRVKYLSRFSSMMLMVFGVLGFVLLGYFHNAYAQTPWYDTDWQYRQKITIDAAQVDANLTDFPVYQDLSEMQAGFFTNVQSDGADIRVTTGDGTTEIARELVSIDTGASSGELHFKASSLSASTDTEFYIYYGNASAMAPADNATYGAQNVWTNGYNAVYHLDENPALPTNFLTNPGAEDNSLNGWTTAQGNVNVDTAEFDLRPRTGSYFFGNGTTGDARIFQEFTLSNIGYNTTEIDNGNAEMLFSAYQANSAATDRGQIILEFRDSGGGVISSTSTPLQAFAADNTWHYVAVSPTIPANTRIVRANLRWTLDAGNQANAAFDDTSLSNPADGDGLLPDSTANGNSLMNNGGLVAADRVSAQIGRGVRFQGDATERLVSPHEPAFSLSGDMAVSMFLKTQGLNANAQTDLLHHASFQDSGYQMLDNGQFNDVVVTRINGGGDFYDAQIPRNQVNDDQWHNITMRREGTTLSAFLDGAFVDSVANTVLGTGMDDLELGSDDGVDMTMDEVRLVNVLRADEWISTAYTNQSAPATFSTAAPEQEFQPNQNTTGEMSSDNFTILRSTFGSGGREDGTSPNYALRDTIGQSTPPGGQSSANYDLEAGYRKMAPENQNTIITITSPNDVQLTPEISGVAGGTGNGSTTWTVTTDNPDGYELSIRADSSPALQTVGGDIFDDYDTVGDPDYNFTFGATESVFGFTPEGADIVQKYLDDGTNCNTGAQENPGHCWSGFTTTDEVISQSQVADTGGVDTNVKFRAAVGADTIQPAGDYQATITATAVGR